MPILSIRRYGDPILRRRAAPVAEITPEVQRLIDDMVETMYDALGIGLAATQVGVALRVLVVDAGGGAVRTYINPEIVERHGEVVGEEGCLSLPGIFADVARAERVVVEARDREGRPVRERAEGLLARVFQHEIDHLDGILFIDRLDKVSRDRIKRRIKKEGLPDEMPAGATAL
ncbi:MAG: peptide deformylase [Candidatus Rokubacteria bacterium]|nr:peptide deformylase [Candidatus Rokubacteria bacterium]